MKETKQKNKKIVFWGAGKVGQKMIELWKFFGTRPECFFDNNKELWGKSYGGVPVLPIDKLSDMKDASFFITCRNPEVIAEQLKEEYGLKSVELGNDCYKMIWYLCFVMHRRPELNLEPCSLVNDSVIFWDLSNGTVMGGVEVWSVDMASKMEKLGFHNIFLNGAAISDTFLDFNLNIVNIPYLSIPVEKAIEKSISEILKHKHANVVCNFVGLNFVCACLAKQLAPERVRIIAIQHSDDMAYYEVYSLWQEYIDKYMVISSRMEDRLLSQGMNKNMLCRLEWQVDCKENLRRKWSRYGECLQIGYAGRVTVPHKRTDILPELAVRLRGRGICFQINIAGTGDYSETLRQRIQEEGLQEYIKIVGYVDRKDIPDFWKKQDIMISCSEREGHSISQTEAMAAGAVPVITDVSGARDDVADGYNGFVVDVGDIDAIVDKIYFLYCNRNELEQMGIQAYVTIYKRQKSMDQTKFWNDLLERIWQ